MSDARRLLQTTGASASASADSSGASASASTGTTQSNGALIADITGKTTSKCTETDPVALKTCQDAEAAAQKKAEEDAKAKQQA